VRACVGAESVGMCMRVRVYSLAYPACNAYAPYCDVTCDLGLHQIFQRYLINSASFGKKVIQYKMYVSIFSTTFVLEAHSKNNLAR
jgi:hypothetical protein